MAARELDWSRPAILNRRERYYAASQKSFMPYRSPMVFSRGERQYLWDEAGKKYIDLLGMNVCISVGHAHPVVNAAVQAQIGQLQHCTTMFSHPVPAQYAEELVARMPQGPDWVVHFTSSGTEAIDLALVMAQSFTRNIDMLALRNAYHGATIGAQSLTGIAAFRHNIPLLPGIHHIANPDPYRGIFGSDTQAYLDEIDRTVQYATPGRLAGLLVEPIQGYGGIVELPPGYLRAASAKVRAAGGILIVDEVQSGFGRTGDHFWGFEHHDVMPEVVVMAKGIGNGFPLGAVVAQRHVADSLGTKFFFNTYGASPMACAACRPVASPWLLLIRLSRISWRNALLAKNPVPVVTARSTAGSAPGFASVTLPLIVESRRDIGPYETLAAAIMLRAPTFSSEYATDRLLSTTVLSSVTVP